MTIKDIAVFFFLISIICFGIVTYLEHKNHQREQQELQDDYERVNLALMHSANQSHDFTQLPLGETAHIPHWIGSGSRIYPEALQQVEEAKEQQMTRCQYCNSKIKTTHETCPKCGAPV